MLKLFEKSFRDDRKNGFTIIELAIVVVIMMIFSVLAVVSLTGKKSTDSLNITVSQVTALLHEAESRSVTQSQGVSWGVHFSNTTDTAPFYALFYSYYSPTTTVSYYRLPPDVAYLPSTLPLGETFDLTFSQVSGLASASTTIGFSSTAQQSLSSSIGISPSGTLSPIAINPLAAKVYSISPNVTTTPGSLFTLTVNGESFTTSSTVQWDGTSLATTYISPTQLTAVVSAPDVAVGDVVNVTVWSDAGGASNIRIFTVNNPAPTLTSISPTSTTANGSGFILTASGSSFVGGASVYWNGSPLSTTYGSSASLTAAVPSAYLASGGNITITVENPSPSAGSSGDQTFVVNNPGPTLTSISPISITAGGSGFTLTVNGSSFVTNSTINWNSSPLTTTYSSTTQLSAAISSSSIALGGTTTVTVTNPLPVGGTSGGQVFTINNPAPTLASISPTSTQSGGSSFVLTATGSNFVSSSTIDWNGSPLTTTYVSPTNATATVPSGDIAASGTSTVTVVNPAPGGGTSAGQTFTSTGYNGYVHERSITVAYANVSTTLSYFPMLVSSTYAWLAASSSGGYVQNPNGYDVAFTSDAGCTTKLNWETESYSSSNGAVNYWVQIPSLSNTTNTVIYVCYDKSSITTDQSNKTGTWDIYYNLVWHLNDNAATTAVKDSTTNNFSGTAARNTSLMATTTSMFGGGLAFNGSGDFVSATTTNSLTGSYTTEIWYNMTASSGILGSRGPSDDGLDEQFSTSQFHGDIGNGSGWLTMAANWSNTFPTKTWGKLDLAVTSTSYNIYWNGTWRASSTISGTPLLYDSTRVLHLGNIGSLYPTYQFTGVLDEFRVSSINRTSGWLLTEYNNQSSPATFYTVGSQL